MQITCKQCGLEKPATKENFRINKKRRDDGTYSENLCSPCHDCAKKRKRDNWAKKYADPVWLAKRHADVKAYRQTELGKEAKRRQLKAYRAKRAAKPKPKKITKAELAKMGPHLPKPAPFCWLWNNPALSEAQAYSLRYRLDEEFAVHQRMRNQLNKKMKRKDLGDIMRGAIVRNGKSNKVERELGYTIAQLKTHLEKQFTDGMNWQSFLAGEIHIDHIIPLASFDLTQPDAIRQAWCISNLRPMWGGENISKSDKILFLI